MSAAAASTAAIDTPERAGKTTAYPVAATTTIYAGTLVALNSSGNAVPASDTAALTVIGRAEATADNSAGSAGDVDVTVKRGTFRFANSADYAVDADDIGKPCYVESDNTVAETSTNSVRAGTVVDVDSDGVWVDTNANPVAIQVTLGSTNGTMAAAADLAAVKVEGEKLGDDVRAIHAALVAKGILRA